MSDLDPDAIRAETVERLVDRAITTAQRDVGREAAGSDLAQAAAGDVGLLAAARDEASRLAERTGHDAVALAAEHLSRAHEVASAVPGATTDDR